MKTVFVPSALLCSIVGLTTPSHARDINSLAEFETTFDNAVKHSRSSYLTTLHGRVWNGDGYWAKAGGGILGVGRAVCFDNRVCFEETGLEYETDRDGYAIRRIRDRWPGETPPDLFAK
jgi:hypothetical protein